MNEDTKHLVYVEIDEEISSIIDRVKNIKRKEIFLCIPKRSIFFQSAINLQILKTKLEEKGKTLAIVTTDRNGENISKNLGVKVIPRVEVKNVDSIEEDDEIMKIQPIQARKNIINEEELPKRFTEKKISIKELIQEFRNKNSKGKVNTIEDRSIYSFMKPNRKLIILMIIFSLGLFSLITYIALPSAVIYIKPKFDNISATVNVTLADERKNKDLLNEDYTIFSKVIQTTTKQTKVFHTVGKEFNGKNASGKVKIVNTADEEWTLKDGTRFMTKSAMIYRSKIGVKVPARTKINNEFVPGTLIVDVEADDFDLYGEPIGSKGNIENQKLTIPGLSKYNQRLIWGETVGKIDGGVTDYRPVVTKEDIESAKNQIKNNLILMSKEDLENYLKNINSLNNTNLVLLDDNKYLKTKLKEMKMSDDLEGSYRDKFEIFAEIDAEGVAFDFDKLFFILKNVLEDRIHPNMKLKQSSITPDNITYDVIEEDDDLGIVKITASIDGIEEYIIDSTNNLNLEFANKIRSKILNLPISEAKNIIANQNEVDKVEIKTWPVWLSKMPHIPEGIKIKVMN